MKKIILLSLFAVAQLCVQGQAIINGNYRYLDNVFFDGKVFIPVRDTVGNMPNRVGALTIRPADTVGHPFVIPVYNWTGSKWQSLGGTGSSYTAGNGLNLSGSQFRLGGTLSANTEIYTANSVFSLNYGAISSPTLSLSGDTSKIGYKEPGGAFSGYSYVKDYGRGKHLWITKGLSGMMYNYQGLFLQDTLNNPVANLYSFGPFELKQSNGNNYFDVSAGRLLMSSAGDTSFYAGDDAIISRALSNDDETKFLTSDIFGRLKLGTPPAVVNIGNSDLSLTGNRVLDLNDNSLEIHNLNNDVPATFKMEFGTISLALPANTASPDPNNYPAYLNLSPYNVSLGSEGYRKNSYLRVDSVTAYLQRNLQGSLGQQLYEEVGVRDSGLYYDHKYQVGISNVTRKVFGVDTTGNLFATKVTAVNPDNANYQRYFAFSRDAVDTTKQLWTMGLVGTPGGSPFHNGGALIFRTYSTSGAVLADRLTIPRSGNITTPAGIQVGTGTFTFSTLGLNTSTNVSATQLVQAGQGMVNLGYVTESAITTVTGDYTVLSSDLYINVNNTADCTITIPAALPTSGGKGRTLYIKKTINNAFNVNVVVIGGTQTIDGGSSIVANTFNQSFHLHDDGANWFTY